MHPFPAHLPIGIAIASVLTMPVMAQTVLEEIIVTATRQETALMEPPASLSAFDAAAMDELGLETAQDLATRTPSLTIAPSRVTIRGVGRPNAALGSDPGVGMYWDGMYFTETDLFGFSNFLDIDRIEVLRGPQGTLYGRNAIGGAINFVSRQPTEEWEGTLRAEAGNYDHGLAQVIVSGPLKIGRAHV